MGAGTIPARMPSNTGSGFPFVGFLVFVVLAYVAYRLVRALVRYLDRTRVLAKPWRFIELTLVADAIFIWRYMAARLSLRKVDWSDLSPTDFLSGRRRDGKS